MEPIRVVFLVLVALSLSVAYMVRSDGVTSDSYQYMRGGTSLLSGRGYTALDGREQTVFPPGYPILLGLAYRATRDPVTAGRYVSVAAAAASIPLVYLLGRLLFSSAVGFLAATLLALFPLRLQTSTMVLSDSAFLALALAGIVLWVVSASRPWAGLGSGLLLGAAYLTRPEGLLILAVCLAVAVLAVAWRETSRRSGILRGALLALGFVVVAGPFWVHLKQHTGRWGLTGKADMNLAVASGRTAGVPFAQLRRLDPNAREIVYPPTAATAQANVYHVLLNLRKESQMLGDAVGPFLLACLGLSVVAVLRSRSRSRAAIVSLAAVTIGLLLTSAFFFLEYRMLLLPFALIILFAAAALFSGETVARHATTSTKTAVWLLALGILQYAAGSALLLSVPIGQPADDITGLLAAVRSEPDAIGPIIGNYREPRALALASGHDFLDLPWEPLPRVLQYASYHGASFLLVRDDDHPDLAKRAQNADSTGRLRPIARLEAGTGADHHVIRLYRILPR